jgi:hypothetical protein
MIDYLPHSNINKDRDQEKLVVKYEGQFESGLPKGFGKIAFKNGSSHEGQFLNGLYHGEGVHVYGESEKNNSLLKYQGMYHKGERKGKGQLFLINGDSYIGSFKKGTFNGFGTYIYSPNNLTKSKYTGMFWKGLEHGNGKEYFRNGFIIDAKWQSGQLEGFGEIIYPSDHPTSIKYIGQLYGGKKHGKGKE